MSMQRAFFAILVGGLVLTLFTISRAQVESRRIEEVKKKSVLAPEDLQVIDAFLNDAVGRLVRTVDFTEVASYRAVILNNQSAQAQYAQRFSEAAGREITEGFDYANNQISDTNRRYKVLTNLLILANELNDPRLVDLGVRMISHQSNAVRYWAVRAATNPGAWDRLSQDQSSASQMARKVIDACNTAVETSTAEVLHLMAQFAGRYDTAAAEELLVRIADARIRAYADWATKYELVDTAILKLLADKMTRSSTANAQLARQFAQLYSFAMQRFMTGVRQNALKDLSRNYLASVLIETEEQCLGKLLGAPQTNIRRAVEAGDLGALQAEHDRVLGGPNARGALPTKFNFTYGSAGSNQQAPLALPEPPGRRAVAETQTPAQP